MASVLGCQQKMAEKSSMLGEPKEEKGLPYRKIKDATFSRSQRLLSKTDFSAVFGSPTGRFSINPIRLLYRNNNLGFSRIGIIVPKKLVRLSAERNRYKRLVREQFRHVKESLPDFDMVLLLNRKANEQEIMQGCNRVWDFLTFESGD